MHMNPAEAVDPHQSKSHLLRRFSGTLTALALTATLSGCNANTSEQIPPNGQISNEVGSTEDSPAPLSVTTPDAQSTTSIQNQTVPTATSKIENSNGDGTNSGPSPIVPPVAPVAAPTPASSVELPPVIPAPATHSPNQPRVACPTGPWSEQPIPIAPVNPGENDQPVPNPELTMPTIRIPVPHAAGSPPTYMLVPGRQSPGLICAE